MTTKERCPQCGSELHEVRYDPNSMLNRDQFDSIKAGDFYCVACRGDRARTGYRYFWRSELTQPEAPAPDAQPTAKDFERARELRWNGVEDRVKVLANFAAAIRRETAEEITDMADNWFDNRFGPHFAKHIRRKYNLPEVRKAEGV